ncbi:MAG: hypothetical protein ABIQ95_09175 [Bdellovibrionia bacterium]
MLRYTAVLVFWFALNTASTAWGDEELSKGPGFYVIVNAVRNLDELDRKFLADVFFKRLKHWPEAKPIAPVDQRADSEVRLRFSESVLSRSVLGVRNYWQQLIFSGRDVPPPELSSDDEVLKFVESNPEAIGYVSATSLTEGANAHGVKAVTIR